MSTNQTPKKERIGGYVSAEIALELRKMMHQLPRAVTIGDVLEIALRREIKRIRKDGWKSSGPPDQLRRGRPLKSN